jgi:hypothetical protein
MLGMMRMELASLFCTVEFPVEWVQGVDADVQIAVKL